MSTATALAGSPLARIYRSRSHSASVTSTAIRKNGQRGAELIRVTTGHARQAITVSLA